MQHEKALHALANALLEYETLTADDVKQILDPFNPVAVEPSEQQEEYSLTWSILIYWVGSPWESSPTSLYLFVTSQNKFIISFSFFYTQMIFNCRNDKVIIFSSYPIVYKKSSFITLELKLFCNYTSFANFFFC